MLRLRLGLLVAASLLVALTAAAALTLRLFGAHQESDVRALLARELERVAELMANPAVGESLLAEEGGSLLLQFVTFGGVVVAPTGEPEPLPVNQAGGWSEYQGSKVMSVSAPWTTGTGLTLGTVRLAYRGDAALATRVALRGDLTRAGLTIALVSTLVALWLLGRELRPLARLAEEASRLDPADPELALPPLRRDEVGRVGRALTQAVDAIRRRKREERDALAAVAHELAAPLTVVTGQLDVLAADFAGEPRLAAARDAAGELLATSQDLMVLAKGGLGLRLELAVVSLADVAERVSREYVGVSFAREDDGLVLAAPERLAQVARNLVRNAVQAVGAGERVSVRVVRAPGSGSTGPDDVLLEVADDGPGLSEEQRLRVFERHFTSRAADGGSGLGLSVVRYLVEAHGGSVTVASTVGAGTTFTVRLRPLEADIDDEGSE